VRAGCKGHRDYEWAMVATSSFRHWLLIRRNISDPPEHWHDTGKVPVRPGEQPPQDMGLIRVTVPEARRMLTAPVRETFQSSWSIWRRRHQARAR